MFDAIIRYEDEKFQSYLQEEAIIIHTCIWHGNSPVTSVHVRPC